VIVTLDPDVEVPLPLHPPLATIDTGSPEFAVALTVKFVPYTFAPGSAKVMNCDDREAAEMVKVLSIEPGL
jgi:hypothetical protein